MRGINDQAEHAQLLAKRLNHYGDNWAHVNPIPLNPIEGSKWTASKPEDEQRFLEILHRAGITATLRDTRGQDIDGACGPLAASRTWLSATACSSRALRRRASASPSP